MSCNDDCCSVSTPYKLNPDWMSKLGNRGLHEMSIPGSHDTCARINVVEWSQCQAWNLGYQLLSGIRFIDIRLRHINNKFDIHHDMLYCGLSFGNVLDICRNFLAKYQGEAIIMRLKEEYKSENCTRTFNDTLMEYMNKNIEIISLSEVIPMLDDVRGKIWLMFDFEFEAGFLWEQAIIQDEYFISTTIDIEKKIIAIRGFFEMEKTKGVVHVNFCSGVGLVGTWPYTVARSTNRIVFDYEGKLGIVVMDFPGEKVIEHIIGQNFPEDWEIINKENIEEEFVII
jgi:1-phosphatidylinositol phosphodiesterase